MLVAQHLGKDGVNSLHELALALLIAEIADQSVTVIP